MYFLNTFFPIEQVTHYFPKNTNKERDQTSLPVPVASGTEEAKISGETIASKQQLLE
jgi:hypothetical protein